jgi:formylglycine-generating enzyme required for sulfatase activity
MHRLTQALAVIAFISRVGDYPANKLGFHDMHGNVWQWCDNLWGNVGNIGVLRGGSWQSPGHYCRTAYRYIVAPSPPDPSVGFRLARVSSQADN